jgi:hypothetical protein
MHKQSSKAGTIVKNNPTNIINSSTLQATNQIFIGAGAKATFSFGGNVSESTNENPE